MKNTNHFPKILFAASALLSLNQMAHCQSVFDPNNTEYYDELYVGFRKTGTNQANHEVVVDIGPATNYTTLTNGGSLTVPNFSLTQLDSAFPDLTYLNWSVFGVSDTANSYPRYSLWLTAPRTNVNNQTTAPQRLGFSAQQQIAANITSVPYGGQLFSQNESSNSLNNTAYLIQEPINTSGNLSSYISDGVSTTNSDFVSWTANIENITSKPFANADRCDFYEIRPTGFTDPHTGLPSGSAYYLGYFQFNTNGTMTFTRASTSVTPPAPVVSITRAGTTTTISFGTTNGATYTLFYTNSAGLTQPTHTWPSVSTNVTGNGSTNSFIDITTDSSRVYRVGAH